MPVPVSFENSILSDLVKAAIRHSPIWIRVPNLIGQEQIATQLARSTQIRSCCVRRRASATSEPAVPIGSMAWRPEAVFRPLKPRWHLASQLAGKEPYRGSEGVGWKQHSCLTPSEPSSPNTFLWFDEAEAKGVERTELREEGRQA